MRIDATNEIHFPPGGFAMAQDPNLQKEIWDARVKIVYGRFIMNAFSAFLGIGIAALLIDHFVMGDMGDAFIKPVMINWALPISVVALIVGFFTNFLPKKKKIDLFTNILYAHQSAEKQIVFPSTTIEAECFTTVPTLGLHDGIRYRVWKTADQLCFFPTKPLIQRISPYESGPITFSVVTLNLSEIRSFESGGSLSRIYKSYDERKKEVLNTLTHAAIRLSYGENPSTAILLEANIANLVALTPVAPIIKVQQPVLSKPVFSVEPVLAATDNNIEAKLQKLQSLYDKGLITEQEYKERKSKLLDNL
jgi:hypothetical protein